MLEGFIHLCITELIYTFRLQEKIPLKDLIILSDHELGRREVERGDKYNIFH